MEASFHPSVKQVLRFFDPHKAIPVEDNKAILVKQFKALSLRIAETAPDSPETTVALRKLVECRDAVFRAMIPMSTEGN